jgi:hypothetical protein
MPHLDPEIIEVGATRRRLAHPHDVDAAPFLQCDIGDLVRGVVVERGDDAIAGLEVKGGEGLPESHRRVFDDGDVPGLGAEELGEGLVGCGDLGSLLRRRLVAAHPGFELEMIGDRVEHRQRHEPGAGVVEVVDGRGAGSVPPPVGESFFEGHLTKVTASS